MAIELISKIKPKNGGNFAMVDAEDVEMPDGTRLPAHLPIALSRADYEALCTSGNIDEAKLYFIVEDTV